MRKSFLFIGVFLLILVASLAVIASQHNTDNRVYATGSTLAIHVAGNQLVNGQGKSIRLIGVNVIANSPCVRPSLNYPFIYGPSNATAAAAMASWNINVVRLTLNEDCWLGINRVNPAFAGSNYQNAIVNFVNLLHKYGMYVILDLHWNAPGTNQSDAQQPMADADHATVYWTSISKTFKNDPAAIFELYNEPNLASYSTTATNYWACWRDGGCTITHYNPCAQSRCKPVPIHWQAEGMQGMLDAIRTTGATNPVMLDGLASANDLSQLLLYLPTDPQHQLVASFHNYLGHPCDTQTCWDSVIMPIAQQIPVVTSEFGENDCQTSFVTQYMQWADQHNVSYLPWVWANLGCNAYGLLANWSGTPSTYGQVFYSHFHMNHNPPTVTTPAPVSILPTPVPILPTIVVSLILIISLVTIVFIRRKKAK